VCAPSRRNNKLDEYLWEIQTKAVWQRLREQSTQHPAYQNVWVVNLKINFLFFFRAGDDFEEGYQHSNNNNDVDINKINQI
jgi:hypothetical protein